MRPNEVIKSFKADTPRNIRAREQIVKAFSRTRKVQAQPKPQPKTQPKED